MSDFDNSYARLPPQFFARVNPTPVARPTLIKFNTALATELGLRVAPDEETLASIFSGNCLMAGSEPISMAYAGHQFGGFVPQLGDGRASLLGEVIDRHGARRDIQLKGSGRTPFSRGGDGRAAIGPVLREYLVSEAMHALRIPATRALAAVSTGESVARERRLPGGIVTRVAASHIRVGTFEYFAAQEDVQSTQRLADMVIDRHYPTVRALDNRYLELLRAVMQRQASLIAAWAGVGFIHGVMNTDNMTVSGETIDFGPCAFMDVYHPDMVFSSIDRTGRYAYSNQPAAAQWNLARFAETLLPLIAASPKPAIELASDVVSAFSAAFDAHWLEVMRAKLGLKSCEAGDTQLAQTLLTLMQSREADFTQTWRRLCGLAAQPAGLGESAAPDSFDWFYDTPEGSAWTRRWHERAAREDCSPLDRMASMRRVNPVFIPRNHRVEQVIQAAECGDYAPFEKLLSVLSKPYEEQADYVTYADAPLSHERVLQTFCGT